MMSVFLIGAAVGVATAVAVVMAARWLLAASIAQRFNGEAAPLVAWRLLSGRQLDMLMRETLPGAWSSLITRPCAQALSERIRKRHRARVRDFEGTQELEQVAHFLEETGLAAKLAPHGSIHDELRAVNVHPRVLRAQGAADYHPFDPPLGAVRFPAEHEPIRSVLLAWPTQYPVRWPLHAQLARDIAQRAEAHIVVPNLVWAQAVELFLRAGGADLANCRFISAPNDDVWIRDFGPTLVQSAAGPVFIANPYVPNGLGFHKRDHELPVEIARCYGRPVHRLPLIVEGGNLLSDGAGRVFMTDSVFAHNPDCDARALREIMRRWFGALELTILPALPQDVSGHVDIALKLADRSNAWVTQAPPGHPWRDTLDEMAAIVRRTPAPGGGTYRVVRMPMAPARGVSEYCYCNSLTLNDAILYPSYAPDSDRLASAAFAELAPASALHAVDFRDFAVGALHCQTKEVPAL